MAHTQSTIQGNFLLLGVYNVSKSLDEQLWVFVARDFSDTPGPRRRDEGDHSGEQFLEECLLPKYQEARARQCKLWVDLDGTEGYATSFLEEAFGGLARRHTSAEVLETLEFKSVDQKYLPDEIRNYIGEAND